MPLKILPKKEWHVYDATNKEKVKHDEEEFLIEEEKKELKALQNDREFRLELLRKRAKERSGEDAEHVDLIHGVKETPLPKTETEKEIEERKKMMDKYTVYLDQKHVPSPWYAADQKPKEQIFRAQELRNIEKEDPMSVFMEKRKPITNPDEQDDIRRSKKVRTPHVEESSVQKLRRKRIEREAKERQKANVLVRGYSRAPTATPDREYYSRYNPLKK